MAQAPRDENSIPVLMGVSSADGVTPVTIYVDPDTHRVLTSAVGSTEPGGSNTQVQFNDAGAISGDAGFTYNKTTDVATIGGVLISGLTASQLVATDGSKNLVSLAVATYPSLTEVSYVKGVTSAIQTQLDAKAPTTAPTFATSITGSYLTASEILITNGSKKIVSAAVATYPSLTELTYVKGVTSAIQTQLTAKAPLASPTFTGTVTMPVGLTGVLRADTGVVSVDSDVTDIVSAASTSAAGKVELAIASEIDTGTDTTRAMPVDQFVASKRNIRWLIFNLVAAGTDCATGTNLGGDFVSPIAGTILQSDTTPFYLYATNSTAGTTGSMVVDINIGGTSIMTTNKLSFDSTEKTTTTTTTPPDLTTTTLAVGNIITIDVDSVHTTPAKGLTVYMAIRE